MNHDAVVNLTRSLNVAVKILRNMSLTTAQVLNLSKMIHENISEKSKLIDRLYKMKKHLIRLIESFDDYIVQKSYQTYDGLYFESIDVLSKNGKFMGNYHLPVKAKHMNLMKKIKKIEDGEFKKKLPIPTVKNLNVPVISSYIKSTNEKVKIPIKVESQSIILEVVPTVLIKNRELKNAPPENVQEKMLKKTLGRLHNAIIHWGI